MCDFLGVTRSKAAAAMAVSILCAITCAAEFVPGRIYFAAGRTEPGPGNQPSNAVYEFDPVTRESRVFATIMERTVVLDGLSFTPDGSGLRAGLGFGGRVIEFNGDGAISTVYEGQADGIGYPLSTAFDGLGNFFVANYPEAVVRFPNDTSPPELVIGRPEIKETGKIAADSVGNLYLNPSRAFPGQTPVVVRVGADGVRTYYPRRGWGIDVSISGDLYVLGSSLFRYPGGDPNAQQVVATGVPASLFLVSR